MTTTKLYIENLRTELLEFSVPEMSLSSARANMARKVFKIEIEASEIRHVLDDDYKMWVIESRKDDAICGSPQDELAESGYPELESVLRHENLLTLVVGGYLFHDLMGKYTRPSTATKYWFDEVVSCTYTKGLIWIHGICYNKQDTKP